MFVVVILAIGMMSVSCFKKKKDDKKNNQQTQQQQNKDINTDIFNLGGQAQGNPNIQNLTPEEQQNLIDNQIDPAKVSEALTKAQNGDKESIMSLAQLYYNLKNKDKVKQILQYGVDKNYPEAIYNLAMIFKEEGNTAEANKLIARLPKGSTTTAGRQQMRQIKMRPGAEAYNRGIDLIKAKRYKEAKVEFEKAYNAGIKEADIRVALLNKELKNESEAMKWFQKAANRGVKEANYEIGAILYDGGKQTESRPYLLKAYNAGNKGLAMPIAMSYHQQNNMTEALKWYKIAAKNGDKSAKETVAQIESGNSGNKNKVTTILGKDSNTSLTDSTISSLKNNSSKETENKAANFDTAKQEHQIAETPNYNVNLERPKNTGNTPGKNTAVSSSKADNKAVAKSPAVQLQQSKIDEKEQKRAEKAVADAIKRASKRKDAKAVNTDKTNAVSSDKSIEDAINKKAAEYK